MLFSSIFYSSLKSAISGTHVVIALHLHIRRCSSFNQLQVTGALFSCSIVIKIHCQHGGETIRKNRKKAKSFSGWVWTSSTLHSQLKLLVLLKLQLRRNISFLCFKTTAESSLYHSVFVIMLHEYPQNAVLFWRRQYSVFSAHWNYSFIKEYNRHFLLMHYAERAFVRLRNGQTSQ